MLRASVETHEQNVNLASIMDGSEPGEIQYGEGLAAFAEAIVSADVDAIATARQNLVTQAGYEVMVDAAGVAANFQRMTRIADATGIKLGAMGDSTEDLRESLGIEEFKK